jgi:uncharacterized delta-60 repeat protein
MDALLRRAAALAGGILVLASLAALPARAAPGDLDTTFGTSGVRFWGYAQEELRALKRMADGRLVLAGISRDGGAATLLVARIGATGTPDATFGTNGIVRLPLGNPDADIRDMALDPFAGTLVFVGTLNGADNLLVALNGSGVPVSLFGTAGFAQPVLPLAGTQRLQRARFTATGLVLVAFEAATTPGVSEDIAIARFDMTGALDASFGSSGVRLAGFTCASANATSLAIDSNAKPVIAGECVAGPASSDSIVARFSASGAADAAFNEFDTPGRVILDFATGARDGIRHLETDAANRLVLAGVAGTAATGLQPFAARLDADGFNDPAYASGGAFAIAAAAGHDITAAALLADGRLVLEMQRPGATQTRVVATVAADGAAATALDLGGPSPGSIWRVGGIVQDGVQVVSAIELGATNSRTWRLSRRNATTLAEGAGAPVVVDPLPSSGVALAIANRPGGGYLVAGYATDATGANRFTVTALTGGGEFDATFAGGGRLVLGQPGIARAVATYPDGRIVLAGENDTGQSVVIRLEANGAADATFGTGGTVTMDFNDPGGDAARAVLVQPDGKIVVGGRSDATGIVVRLDPDGGYDGLFAGSGYAYTGSDIRALALDADGRIVAAGHWKLGAPRFFFVARFLANGAADSAFGTTGYFFINFSGIDNEFNAMTLMPGGRIAAAGLVRSASPPYQESRLYRFAPVGEPDTSASGVVLGTGSGVDEAFAVAVQADGRLLVAGHDGDAAYVARLLPVSLAGDAAWGPFGFRTYPGIARAATGIALDPANGNAVLSLEGPDGTQGAMRIVAPSVANLVAYVRGPISQPAGATGTYTITIANQTGSAVNGLTLAATSTGSAGFTHAAAPTTDCPATVSGAVGTSSFSLSGVGAPLAPGQSCTVTLSLTASSASSALIEIAPGALVASNGVSNLDVALLQWFVIGSVDTTPDPFAFTAQAGVPAGTVRTSNPITVTGIDAPAPISVTGGSYSIGCTTLFATAAGTIANGQTVCVRHVAASGGNATVTTTLTIGGISANFTSTTAPVAQSIDFAPLADRAIGASPFTLLATASSGLPVAFMSLTPAVCSVAGPTATLLATGACSIAADQAGSAAFLAAPQVVRTFAVLADPNRFDVVEVSMGDRHACARLADGSVRCWGANANGRLGDGTTVARLAPVTVGVASSYTIAAGSGHSCSASRSGALSCWGENGTGAVGNSTTADQLVPVAVPGGFAGSRIERIAAGDRGTCVATAPGFAYCWGENNAGQVANGGSSPVLNPSSVTLADVVDIAAGDGHRCAVSRAGALHCWGRNDFGQVGNGGAATAYRSTQAIGLAGVTAVAAGGRHTCAVTGGVVRCWGDNGSGQLGVQPFVVSAANAPLPAVGGLPGAVRAVALGDRHSCALTVDGAVWCWGRNGEGQLGDATTATRSLPAPVPGLGSGVVSIAARGNNSCALKGNGAVVCWGENADGQLGDGTTQARLAPVTVTSLEGDADPPDGFAFTARRDVELADSRSETVTITGMSRPRLVAVTGGAYSIGCSGIFTTRTDVIAPGESICVQHRTGPARDGSATNTRLTIGGVSADFVTRTLDETPSDFSFAAQVAVLPGSTRTSEAVTITGIDSPAMVSVTGGQVSLGCNGTFGAGGLLAPGQAICARHVAASGFLSSVSTVVTVGGVTATFTSTTFSQDGDVDGDGIPNGIELATGRNPIVKDNDIFADATLFARQVYRDFLGREGDAAGVAYWANEVATGARSRVQVIQYFYGSAEFQEAVAPVIRLYFAFFLRTPDFGGLDFWVRYYRSGSTTDDIAAFFATSAEFASRYGALSDAQFITLVYQNVLGRAPDPSGFAFWTGQLTTGARNRGQVMLAFSDSAEYRASILNEVIVTSAYYGLLRRTPDPGGFGFWVRHLDDGNPAQGLINNFLNSAELRARFLP